MLRAEPTWRTSAGQAPKTANKNRILEKLNHDSRPTYVDKNVSKVGFIYARGFVPS